MPEQKAFSKNGLDLCEVKFGAGGHSADVVSSTEYNLVIIFDFVSKKNTLKTFDSRLEASFDWVTSKDARFWRHARAKKEVSPTRKCARL